MNRPFRYYTPNDNDDDDDAQQFVESILAIGNV